MAKITYKYGTQSVFIMIGNKTIASIVGKNAFNVTISGLGMRGYLDVDSKDIKEATEKVRAKIINHLEFVIDNI